MTMIDMIELKPCPFCGADALLKWVLDDHAIHNGHGGKTLRVSCSRDGECPSPEWAESADEHEDDAACLESVTRFWNTRAEDWAPDEIIRLRVKLAKADSELRITRIERDRAMRACEEIATLNTTEQS
jgi:hypothetical protein